MKRILWFRRDLRISDNPLLGFEGEVLPIFIFDTNILDKLPADDKRLTYIFHYVTKLKSDLIALGLNLKIFYGKPVDVFASLMEYGFDEVVASGDYDAYAKERDREISHMLHFRYLQDTYIFRHDEVLKDDGSPYLVFTPYYKKAKTILPSKDLTPHAMKKMQIFTMDYEGITCHETAQKSEKKALALETLGFEKVALAIKSPQEKLTYFTKHTKKYQENRDYFFMHATSELSVDLRFGTIGVREVLREVMACEDSEPFVRQLIFRDFYATMLFHMPYIAEKNYKYSFNGVPDTEKFERFCSATTGVPIVDAGVRELLQTGNMHNRVRMIVASFFTKDLLLPWQWGEKFFAQHLLDYDAASNILSWQWSAGTGVDPQPYFRVFNPYLQSKKFDKEALYIKRYCPELATIDAKFLHDEDWLILNNIKNYPKPIVAHKEAAKAAIEGFKKCMH
jgi:deoxyribodipyrimidine photo-lyase